MFKNQIILYIRNYSLIFIPAKGYLMIIYYYRHFESDGLSSCNNIKVAKDAGWWRRGGELDGVGKKSGIKLTVYSLQNAVCCLAVIFHEGLPCGAEWVRSPGGGCNNGTLYRAPGAQIQHPYIIIHIEKKAGGTFAKRKDWGTAKLLRYRKFRIKYFSNVSRDYIVSCQKVAFNSRNSFRDSRN